MEMVRKTGLENRYIFEIEACVKKGDYREALAFLREAESSGDEHLIGLPLFLTVKAQVLNLLGDYKQALESSQAAYCLAKEDSDNDLIARIQTESAKSYLSLGRTELAEREYRDVISAYRRGANIGGIIDTLNRLAQISFIEANYVAAEKLLREALDYAEAHGLSDKIAKLNGNLGQIASRLGNLDQAVNYILISIEKNSELRAYPNLCRAHLSLAFAEIRLGNYDTARKSLRKAETLIEKHNLTREFGIFNEYLAELEFDLGNKEEALTAIEKALEHGYKLSEASALISQGERLKAEILIQKEDFIGAQTSGLRALEVSEKIGEHLETGQACRVLAEIANLNHDSEQARALIIRAIELIRKSDARYDLARTYLSAYQIYRGNIGESQHYLKLARELYANMRLDLNLSRFTAKIEDSGSGYEVSTPQGEIIDIVTSNRKMKAIMRALESIKDSDIPILIGGETGTGKDLLAKYIHYSSKRRTGPFISVNCAAIPPSLAESELFGHVKGAFTNALDNQEGLILAAHGGTLFLNEIGELSPAIQAKLLGVLEHRKIMRVGDPSAREVDFRLICATNRDLEEEVRSGNFRQDLYFRIAVMTFELPSLCQRGDDIFELIIHYLKEKGFEADNQKRIFSEDIKMQFRKYDWPGNIRELRNELNLLTLSYPGDTERVIASLVEKLSDQANQIKPQKNSGLADEINAFERNRILEVLAQNDYIIRKAAIAIRMPEATLRSKIKKHNIIIA